MITTHTKGVLAKGVLAGLALVLMASSSALAADADAFGTRLKAAATEMGLVMNYTGAEGAGADVTLKGVTFGAAAGTEGATDLTFTNVAGSDAAGYTADSVSTADIDVTETDSHVVVKDIGIEKLKVSGTGGAKLPNLSSIYFDSASIGGVTVDNKGKTVVTLTGTQMTNTQGEGGTLATDINLGDFTLDFAAADPADETTKFMIDFGYPQLKGTGSLATTWNPASGETTLDPLQISFENAGELNVSCAISGYTEAFNTSLRQLQQQMASNPEAAQSGGAAIFGLISQLSIGSMEIAYTDASFTGKLLDYYAKQNGITREQLVGGLVAQLPQSLAALQNPTFQSEVTTAVTSFLQNPKSLTVAVAPDAPIGAAQIVGAAMGAPQTLPDVLKLKVTANTEQ